MFIGKICDVIDKKRVQGFDQGFLTPRNGWKHDAEGGVLYCFEVFGTPGENRSTSFWAGFWLKIWSKGSNIIVFKIASGGSNSIVFQNSIWYINHSFSIPLQRPNYFINSVDKTKVLHVRRHHRRNTTVLFLRSLTLPSKSVFIWYHTTYLSESKHSMRNKFQSLMFEFIAAPVLSLRFAFWLAKR